MRYSVLVLSAVTLAACSPAVPDSGAGSGAGKGVGFDGYGDYNSYRSARDAELTGRRPAATVTAAPLTPAPVTSGPIAGAPLSADGGPVVAAPADGGPVVAAGVPNHTRISDEQDFDAVANRQTIESDAERLARQRAAYQVIEPTAVPTRPADGPNIVAYALSTNNPVGQKVYRRSLLSTAKFQRNCDRFNSDDSAQEAFLRAGGPERDRSGLDPDGDGFACSWDPNPFRKLRS
jgi:hypothetical protein